MEKRGNDSNELKTKLTEIHEEVKEISKTANFTFFTIGLAFLALALALFSSGLHGKITKWLLFLLCWGASILYFSLFGKRIFSP